MDLPLAGRDIVRVEVASLQLRKPALDGSSGVAVRGAEYDLQPEVLVTSSALLALVIRSLNQIKCDGNQ